MNVILIYFLIGFIVGSFIWYRICKNQTASQKTEDNTGILIALPCLIFLWPVSIAIYIHYLFSNKCR